MSACSGVWSTGPGPIINLLLLHISDYNKLRAMPVYVVGNKIFAITIDDLRTCTPDLTDQQVSDLAQDRDWQLTYEKDITPKIENVSAKRCDDLIQQLLPNLPDYGRSCYTILLRCDPKRLESVCRILFGFSISDIKCACVNKIGNTAGSAWSSRHYLLWLNNLSLPMVVSQLILSEKAEVFYPAQTSDDPVWIRWGSRYDFDDPDLYNIFKSDPKTTVLINADGTKDSYKSGKDQSESIKQEPLKRFVRFDRSSALKVSAAKQLAAEIAISYPLHLQSEILRESAIHELEELRLMQSEIQERIMFLEDVEAKRDSRKVHTVLFYSGSLPEAFHREQSRYRLNELRFFHGHLGSLGEGMLVSTALFIDPQFDQKYQIPHRLYPSNGMIFRSNPHWENAGLRILTPYGFDLAPYIEMERADADELISFIISQAEQRGEDLLTNYKDYIFLLFPADRARVSKWETAKLECVFVRESEFQPSRIKLRNMKVLRANSSAAQMLSSSLDELFSDQLHKSFERLGAMLDNAFQQEYVVTNALVDDFFKTKADLEESIRRAHANLKDQHDKIMELCALTRTALVSYETYLGQRLGEYRTAASATAPDLQLYLDENGQYLNTLSANIKRVLQDDQRMQIELRRALQLLGQDAARVSQQFEHLKKSYSEIELRNINLLDFINTIRGELADPALEYLESSDLKEFIEKMLKLISARLAMDQALAPLNKFIELIKKYKSIHQGDVIDPNWNSIDNTLTQAKNGLGVIIKNWKDLPPEESLPASLSAATATIAPNLNDLANAVANISRLRIRSVAKGTLDDELEDNFNLIANALEECLLSLRFNQPNTKRRKIKS